jgi:hypothetical protein
VLPTQGEPMAGGWSERTWLQSESGIVALLAKRALRVQTEIRLTR